MRAIWMALLVVVCGVGVHAGAELRLPKMLSDHAVLQRRGPIRIWGWATPGARLTVALHGQSVPATADRIGEWTAWLMPEEAGGPYTLTVAGDGETKTLSDLLIGDVWLASGQSNMEMPLKGFMPGAPLKDSAKEIAAATKPQLRLLMVEHRVSDYPLDDVKDGWTTCTPETAASFSAVAYFFGREIAAKEHVPVGLIDSTWGGTPADSWVSMEAFGTDANLIPAFASRGRFEANIAHGEAMQAAEKREIDAAKAAGKPAPSFMWHPFPGSWQPAALYNGMIAPLTNYSIKGFLWYQGETNSAPDRAPHYATLFRALIEDWRGHFAQGELPFLYAQISSFHAPGEEWGILRDAQRRALALTGTAMAMTTDVGDPDNVHPADKQTVGARMAAAARGMVYGETVEYAPPLFREVTTEAGGMRVWFDHARGLRNMGAKLEGFEVAGADHRFLAAEAMVEGETVRLRSSVAAPVYARYAWSNVTPTPLLNAAGLPASTFTSEEVPTP